MSKRDFLNCSSLCPLWIYVDIYEVDVNGNSKQAYFKQILKPDLPNMSHTKFNDSGNGFGLISNKEYLFNRIEPTELWLTNTVDNQVDPIIEMDTTNTSDNLLPQPSNFLSDPKIIIPFSQSYNCTQHNEVTVILPQKIPLKELSLSLQPIIQDPFNTESFLWTFHPQLEGDVISDKYTFQLGYIPSDFFLISLKQNNSYLTSTMWDVHECSDTNCIHQLLNT